MSLGLCVFLCVLSFAFGEFAGFFTLALVSANKEDDNDDKQ